MSKKNTQIYQILQSDNFASLKDKITYNVKAKNITWMKCGGNITALFKPNNEIDLIRFLRNFPLKNKVFFLGNGSNVIFRDDESDIVLVILSGEFAKITDINACKVKNTVEIKCGCATQDVILANHCANNNITGLEFLCTIPGTIGGNVRMNAGCYNNELSKVLKEIEWIDMDGNKFTSLAKDINFSYRTNPMPHNIVFTQATLHGVIGKKEEILAKMKQHQNHRIETQPQNCRTSGSTFTNPPNIKAWQVVKQCGLQGKAIGGASVSSKHANFIINNGNATTEDIERLGELVRKTALSKLGINLKWD
ncbi:MAG: UDP-N-acetylmuramate dehydrogenase [Alphaproteobacteria bacterium]|nr:UDP-N-acetylmuramate dehydrogenase [Rickettsiales bacterium]